MAALFICFVAGDAFAQSDSREMRLQIDALKNQIVNLRAQITDLERVVFADGTPPRTTSGDAAPSSAVSERLRQRLAIVETDIDEVGEWQRTVTGRFDELDNMIRRLEGRIERLVADVDFRLSALEGGGAATAGDPSLAPSGTGADPVTSGETASLSRQGGNVAGEVGGGYEPSAEPQSLGTIPVTNAEAAATQEFAAQLPPGAPKEQFDQAFALLRDARYEEADIALGNFAQTYPEHRLAEVASFWRGESQYARQMFGDAARTYALNLRQFPDGSKAPENMVKLGMALVKLGRADEACQAFDKLAQDYPDMATNIRQAARRGRTEANCP